MNDLTKRIIFGLIYVALIVAASLSGPLYFYGLFFMFMLVCVYEFIRIIDLDSIYPYLLAITAFSVAVISNNNLLVFKDDLNERIIIGILISVIYLSLVMALVSSRKIAIQYVGKNFLTLVYVALPFGLLIKIPYLNFDRTFDTSVILGIFFLIWSNDVFAFLIGKNFGRHKLIERVSPNKTIEGFLGGFIFTFVAAYVVAKYCSSVQPLQWFTIAILVSVFGVLGDLIESMFKRQAGLKDSSNLLPGHGGFLDRLDSIIFATPFIYIYLFLTT